MECLLCNSTNAATYICLKQKYFCLDCLTSTYLYKSQQELINELKILNENFGPLNEKVTLTNNVLSKFKTPTKTLKINLTSAKKRNLRKLFLMEIVNICKTHNMSLVHEDSHGDFLVCEYNESFSNHLLDAKWLGID